MKSCLIAAVAVFACRIVNADQFDQIVITNATSSATVHEFNPDNFSMGSSGPTFNAGGGDLFAQKTCQAKTITQLSTENV
jgi:hypothetical protein